MYTLYKLCLQLPRMNNSELNFFKFLRAMPGLPKIYVKFDQVTQTLALTEFRKSLDSWDVLSLESRVLHWSRGTSRLNRFSHAVYTRESPSLSLSLSFSLTPSQWQRDADAHVSSLTKRGKHTRMSYGTKRKKRQDDERETKIKKKAYKRATREEKRKPKQRQKDMYKKKKRKNNERTRKTAENFWEFRAFTGCEASLRGSWCQDEAKDRYERKREIKSVSVCETDKETKRN